MSKKKYEVIYTYPLIVDKPPYIVECKVYTPFTYDGDDISTPLDSSITSGLLFGEYLNRLLSLKTGLRGVFLDI